MKFGYELPDPGKTAARAPRPSDEVPAQEPMRGANRAARRKPDADQKKVRRQMQRDQQAQQAGRRTASMDDDTTIAEPVTVPEDPEGYFEGGGSPIPCKNCKDRTYFVGLMGGPRWMHYSTFAQECDPTSPVFNRSSTVTKEHQMSYQRREAEILRKMTTASLTEQRNLAVELDFIRSERQASLQAARDVDLADSVIRQTMTPVRVHEHHTASTDWILEAPSGGADYDHPMRTSATLWFSSLHPAVAADRDEFHEQARGMARREAGRFGEDAILAGQVFLDTVARLREKIAGDTIDPNQQSGNAESTVTDYDTDADQDPMYAEDWDTDTDMGHHPEMPGATGGRRTAEKTCPSCEGSGVAYDMLCQKCGGYGTVEGKDASRRTAGEVPEAFKENWDKDGDDDSEDGGDDVKNGDKPWEKESRRKTAVSLTNVGIEGDKGVGTKPDGTRVKFNLSAKDLADLKAVLYSDLAVNFSGVDVEESDIVKDASRHTAGEYQGGSPKDGDTATCHKDNGKIEFFAGEWMHLKGGPSHNDVHPASKAEKEASRTASEGQTCSVCGDKIAKDPASEDPSTYHHDNGEKHDHEAKPSGESKESRRVTAAARPLYQIAEDVRANWPNVYFGAVPYLDAMSYLTSIDDRFGDDTGREVVAYFLSNTSYWRGPEAARLKKELKDLQGGRTSARTATFYCTNHDVFVGDGNRETHSGDGCKIEQRKSEENKEGSRRTANDEGFRLFEIAKKHNDADAMDALADPDPSPQVLAYYRDKYKEGSKTAGPFSMSDAKNDDGEWIMSPEEIRAEMSSEFYGEEEDFYGDDYTASKHSSAQDSDAQRLAAFRARVAANLNRA